MKVKGSPEWLENWEHLVITGKSKAGKTTLGNEIYTETDRIAIAIDQLKLGRFKGSTTSSVHGVKSLLKQGKTRVVFEPSYDNTEANKQIHAILDFIYTLSKRNKKLKWLILWDEAHNYATANSSPAVRSVKEGRNKNIKNVFTTQEPQVAHKSLYRQGTLIWVGGVTPWGKDYLDEKHIPVDKIENQDDYNFTVFNDDREVKAKGKTNSKY